MKTVVEASKEYRRKFENQSIFDLSERDKIEQAFIAGANFAQGWIDIKEVLPDNGTTVLIKDKNNYVGLACRRNGDWDYKFKNMITHWRYITLK